MFPRWAMLISGILLILGAILNIFYFRIWGDFTEALPDAIVKLGVAITGTGGVFAIGVVVVSFYRDQGDGRFFRVNARRRLTTCTALINICLLIVLALAVIDTLGIRWHNYMMECGMGTYGTMEWGAATAALPAIGAWLINQLKDLGSGKSWLASLPGWVVDAATLIVGVLLFGALAVAADTLVHFILWRHLAWPAGQADVVPLSNRFELIFFGVALGGLVLITWLSTGFINLSSLHNFYASRLTRSYLGGANTQRLLQVNLPGPQGTTRDALASDDMLISDYMTIRTPAPLHLINVTLNETTGRDGSPLVDRDRKGLPLVFAPDGVFLDAAVGAKCPPIPAPPCYAAGWGDVGAQVERLSLGQLCAISGAAVSTGMGQLSDGGMAVVKTGLG